VDVEPESEEIAVLREPIDRDRLRELVDRWFGDMVKYVVDVERGVIAVGGELHADGEAVLLADGSRPTDLWDANYYPGRGEEECIEYTSLINVRPAAGNRAMELADPDLRGRVRQRTFELLGRGEPLT
jgi:hypothetical protein